MAMTVDKHELGQSLQGSAPGGLLQRMGAPTGSSAAAPDAMRRRARRTARAAPTRSTQRPQIAAAGAAPARGCGRSASATGNRPSVPSPSLMRATRSASAISASRSGLRGRVDQPVGVARPAPTPRRSPAAAPVPAIRRSAASARRVRFRQARAAAARVPRRGYRPASGRSSRRWQRERIVGSNRPGALDKQEQHGVRRRLFQRLQQRIGGGVVHVVGGVDDGHAPAAGARRSCRRSPPVCGSRATGQHAHHLAGVWD